MKKIFEPVKMNHIELKNRLIRSATWEGIANPDGSATSEAYEIYEELAKGGIGAIITGFTSVALHDYYFGGMMRLCDDALIPQYTKLTDIIHAEGLPVITQLALGAPLRIFRFFILISYTEKMPGILKIRRFRDIEVEVEEKIAKMQSRPDYRTGIYV